MITAALLGNPNVGKTTLFNLLTGLNQYVGNWAGVTVEKKEGFIDSSIKIVDLPGIYAMDTFSNEEKVSKNFLIEEKPDVIINIIDASNLDRNLYLTTQLLKFNIPIVLVLNMIDVAENKGINIDYESLSKKLRVTVIPIVASKGKGIDKIKEILTDGNFLRLSADNDFHLQGEAQTYSFIADILDGTITSTPIQMKKSVSDKIDEIALNKFAAYPIFIAIMYLIFQFTFSWMGTPMANLLHSAIANKLIPVIEILLLGTSPWFNSFIINGIIGGVGSVIVFLPVILSLFLGISFLEDSGYMARSAFIMDRVMRKMGLSGKAFIPLIVGFGCSVPAIMSARTLESEKDRKLTALIVPLMSCNARLPVYALFASVFFTGSETIVVFSLYGIGIILAFLIGLLFKNTIFKKDEEPFIIELPQYRLPELKTLIKHTWDKGKGFLKKAGTLIFSVSVFVWLLSNFSFKGMSDINSSFLASIGNFIAPLFSPLGFGTWQNSVSLLTGLMAKEVIVGTMGVIYGSNLKVTLMQQFTPASAYTFLVFVLLYTPCVSVIATMRKEYGRKMAIFSVSYQLVLAWTTSFIVYNILRHFI